METTKALSADTRRRIGKHITNLANLDGDLACRAERNLIRFRSKAVAQRIEAASSPDPQVRFRAVWALGKSRDARALDTIVGLTRDPDERVRYDAAMALGEFGDRRAVPVLLQLAKRPASRDGLESAAAMALSKLGIELSEEAETA